MNKHPGLTLKEYVKLMDFYPFTEETLEIAFRRFNTFKNTFYGVCGPFMLKGGRWFPVYNKPDDTNIVLAEENTRLRNIIDTLKRERSMLVGLLREKKHNIILPDIGSNKKVDS